MSTAPTGALVGSYAISALMLLLALSGAGSIITYIIIVVANRADPDPTGKRTSTIYHVGTAFLTLWLEIAGVITIFVTLFALIGASGNRYFSSAVHPLRDATVRGITIGLLLSVVGGMVTLTHRGKAIALAESDPDESSPAKRVVRSYAAAVSFISVIVVVVTGLIALWSVLGLIAPGVYEAGSRTSDVRMLLDEATVLAVFAWVFSSHRQIMAGRSGH